MQMISLSEQQKDEFHPVKNEKHVNDVAVVVTVVTCIIGVVVVLGSMWIHHLQTDTSYPSFIP